MKARILCRAYLVGRTPLPPKSAAELGRLRRFVLLIGCVPGFCRFVLPIRWVSVILPICSADLLGVLGFWDT